MGEKENDARTTASPLLLEAPMTIPAEKDHSAVTLQGVAVRFGERTVWRQATFTVTPGEFIAIVGPNGARKSTMLHYT